MAQRIAYFTLIVDDYDRAIEWYTNTLGFALIEDTALSATKRWVLIAPPDTTGSGILIAQATSTEQVEAIGNQCGGRVFLFLHTDDFIRDHAALKSKGVAFVREPEQQPWGMVAVFRDLYGNLWDLVEPVAKNN